MDRLIDIQKMAELPLASKIEVLEAVSAALSSEEDFESPSWHEKELVQREHELEEPSKWLSLNDIKRRLTV